MRPTRRSLCVFSFLLLLLLATSVAQVGNPPQLAPNTRVIAVLSAMTLEIETLGQQLTDKTEMTVQGIQFTTGSLKERRIVLAHSGMGKVNAAMAATLVVEQFQPTHVLFTGIAGGLNAALRPGDVVIGAKSAYHDYGEWTPEGFRVGRTVAQICWQRRVPCLILRSLSDSAGAKASENVLFFEKSAAQNAALLVTGIVRRLEAQ